MSGGLYYRVPSRLRDELFGVLERVERALKWEAQHRSNEGVYAQANMLAELANDVTRIADALDDDQDGSSVVPMWIRGTA